MKINLNELSRQAIESTVNSTKMRLSEHASSMVFQLFTKSVYSNPIGTVVREITSNCFDSHVEANVNSPVIIRKNVDKETNEISISFIDFGVGMSPDRMMNIYGVYFESTKRVDNTQIGGFGVGAKSVLAYKRSTGYGDNEYDNSFYVITIFDNIKYYYCIYEGSDSPIISLLHEEPTTEHNGTEVRIPVLSKDVDKFTKEMVKQLYYFENIIFENFEDHQYDNTLMNTYQIVRGKNFLFRGNEYSDNVHICLGRVAYPIDFGILGVSSYDYRLPIALRLEVGDLNVTVSREAIDYSDATIKMLNAKLIEAKNEIIELLTKQYAKTCTLRDYFDLKNNFGKVKFPNGMELHVGNLIKQNQIELENFIYKGLIIPTEKNLFDLFFNSKRYGKINHYSKQGFTGSYTELQKTKNVLYVEGDFNRKLVKQGYLKQLHGIYYIITKRNFLNDDFFHVLFDISNITGTNDANVQAILRMQDEYYDIVKEFATDYDSLEVPQDFIDSLKQKRIALDSKTAKTLIPVTIFSSYQQNERVMLFDLFKTNVQIFYGTTIDESELKRSTLLFNILFNDKLNITSYDSNHRNGVKFYNNQGTSSYHVNDRKEIGVMFLQISKTNVKYMKYCKNANHVSTFKGKMLYRKEDLIKKAFENRDVATWYNNLRVFYRDKKFCILNDIWGNKIAKIREYVEKNIDDKYNDIRHYKEMIQEYYSLDVKTSKEEIEMKKLVADFDYFVQTNDNIISYIKLPYLLEDANPELIKILKTVMLF